MKVLIACESSGVVRGAFRALGHDAWSCDLLPAEDDSPYHLLGDMREVLALTPQWDLIGFHPPCTYLCGSGIHWNNRGRGWDKTNDALALVEWCLSHTDTPFYLENPRGLISTRIRKPDQEVQPYWFGDDASKLTCLWLNRLPPLVVNPAAYRRGRIVIHEGKPVERWANQTDSGQNRLGPSDDRWRERSRTYPGIANAMASQWSSPSPNA